MYFHRHALVPVVLLLIACGDNVLGPFPDESAVRAAVGPRLHRLELAAGDLRSAAEQDDLPGTRAAWRSAYRLYLEAMPVAEPVVDRRDPLLVMAINVPVTDPITPTAGFHVLASLLFDGGQPRAAVDGSALVEQTASLESSLRRFRELFEGGQVTPATVLDGMHRAVAMMETWADTSAAPDYPSGTLREDVGSAFVGVELAWQHIRPLVIGNPGFPGLAEQFEATLTEAQSLPVRRLPPLPEDIIGVAEAFEEHLLESLELLLGGAVGSAGEGES